MIKSRTHSLLGSDSINEARFVLYNSYVILTPNILPKFRLTLPYYSLFIYFLVPLFDFLQFQNLTINLFLTISIIQIRYSYDRALFMSNFNNIVFNFTSFILMNMQKFLHSFKIVYTLQKICRLHVFKMHIFL